MFRRVSVDPPLHLLHHIAQGNFIVGISMPMLPVAVVEYNIKCVALHVQRYGALIVVVLIIIFHVLRILLLVDVSIIDDLIPSSFSFYELRHDNDYLTRSDMINDPS